jgi:hypothetical protein
LRRLIAASLAGRLVRRFGSKPLPYLASMLLGLGIGLAFAARASLFARAATAASVA